MADQPKVVCGLSNGAIFRHTDERPFSYKVCYKTFALSSHLNYHMSTHTQQCTFTCKLCSQKFIDMTSLIAHEDINTLQSSGANFVMCSKYFTELCFKSCYFSCKICEVCTVYWILTQISIFRTHIDVKGN